VIEKCGEALFFMGEVILEFDFGVGGFGLGLEK
jgi:hypothetical protein